MITASQSLALEKLLVQGDKLLGCVQDAAGTLDEVASTIELWSAVLRRPMSDGLALLTPGLQQSIVMGLLPAKAFAATGSVNYLAAIDEHLRNLGVVLSEEAKDVLVRLCVNCRRLRGLNKTEARSRAFGIADVRRKSAVYRMLDQSQGGRCYCCGADLRSSVVAETLEHLIPKHLGDDEQDGCNWALACESCNDGKGETFAWSTAACAYDFVGRKEFDSIDLLRRNHRWVTLMRERRCSFCLGLPEAMELFVFRRVETGLPIPGHCSVACISCGLANAVDFIRPDFCSSEVDRLTLPPYR